ncbi:DUF4270 domain-containing protein [Psychroflexus sp. YR1-1]|uniref:DUF4270 domain-containing protein n=1 Tax=Psychroflexus aurantiacus TaxID=2709310 RepID=A0A6B3R100_9FLAO|nr:DUF4270 domain-containing protein [Psychroflexus aurantiacus]NEV92677.1 DUF4270 domain-containing protein [Psychroflexus aurantiacus]
MSKFALRSLASVFVLTFLWSCENEYSEVGTDFINSIAIQPAYEIENITAYSVKHNSIQTNGSSNYLLGKYDDPEFGVSETKILTQLSLTGTSPEFADNTVIDSVVMTLPFYSRQVENEVYELDSVFGDGSFKINVFQSNHYLRDLDPGSESDFREQQLYFTNQLDEFRSNIESTPIVTSQVIDPSEFTEPVEVFQLFSDGTKDTLSLSPRIRIKMPNQYFQDKIITPSTPEALVSNNAFKNYLRGFLIEAEQQETASSMALFNLDNPDANITIYFRNEVEAGENQTDPVINYGQYVLNFNGIKLNLYDDNFAIDLSNQNLEEGEENIYLKGGEGSSGIIELFTGPDQDGDGVSDELEELRAKNWLINEASLDFYINEDIAESPRNRINRIFLFNLDDNVVLEDFARDPTASDNPNLSRQVHLGPLTEDDNGDLFYKIRLTSYINNVINNDSTSVRLGLYVTPNVNNPNLVRTRNTQSGFSENVPRAMLETPRGIVLHGNQSPNEAKKLKLRIIYTKTN